MAIPVPMAVVPSNRVTVLPTSAEPEKIGVAILVRLSVSDAPVSDAANRSGAVGAVGATVSITTGKGVVVTPTLPATSITLAVMLWVPFASAAAVLMLHCPSRLRHRADLTRAVEEEHRAASLRHPGEGRLGHFGDAVGIGQPAVGGRRQRHGGAGRCGIERNGSAGRGPHIPSQVDDPGLNGPIRRRGWRCRLRSRRCRSRSRLARLPRCRNWPAGSRPRAGA